MQPDSKLHEGQRSEEDRDGEALRWEHYFTFSPNYPEKTQHSKEHTLLKRDAL